MNCERTVANAGMMFGRFYLRDEIFETCDIEFNLHVPVRECSNVFTILNLPVVSRMRTKQGNDI